MENSDNFKIGFIRENNIITQYSSESDKCKQSLIIKDLNGTSYLLKKIQSQIFFTKLDHHLTDLRLNIGNAKNLYAHHSYLVNGSDLIEQLNEFIIGNTNIDIQSSGDLSTIKFNSYFDNELNQINNDPLHSITSSISDGFLNLYSIIKRKIIFVFFFYYFF